MKTRVNKTLNLDLIHGFWGSGIEGLNLELIPWDGGFRLRALGFRASEELNLELIHGAWGSGFGAWGGIESRVNSCLTPELTLDLTPQTQGPKPETLISRN